MIHRCSVAAAHNWDLWPMALAKLGALVRPEKIHKSRSEREQAGARASGHDRQKQPPERNRQRANLVPGAS
jgi:hypothetical protein